MYVIDIETESRCDGDDPYALEPYRVKTGQSRIIAMAIYHALGVTLYHVKQSTFERDCRHILEKLAGEEVYCHRATFDVSYLYATFGEELVKPIKWRDSLNLCKWVENGQKAINYKYSLIDCVTRHCKNFKEYDEFAGVKSVSVKPGEEYNYWLRRCKLDVLFTYRLVLALLKHFDDGELPKGFKAVSGSIYPISKGYVTGIPVDIDELDRYEKKVNDEEDSLLNDLGLNKSQITSTKQLATILFTDWGLEPVGYTPSGAPSTSKDNLNLLYTKYKDERLKKIIDVKSLATMKSKYIKGFRESINYIGTNKIHGTPNILSTITGRMTYSTTFFKKPKWRSSIAMHQLPRKEKSVKRCLIAPPGYKVLYMDFNAQEGRVMAVRGPEPTMINSYNNGRDLHSELTETIFGSMYDDIVEANKIESPAYLVEQRQAGKLTGLSSLYRIGAKSLANKFFTTYGYEISIQTAHQYLKSFKQRYPGVVQYWKSAITSAKRMGYAQAFGDWRYRINTFDWIGESSSINHPIQGGGSMLTYTAISVINVKWPQLILVSQVHDSLAYFIPKDNAEDLAYNVISTMNNLNYGKILGFKQTVRFILNGGIGDNFSDIDHIL